MENGICKIFSLSLLLAFFATACERSKDAGTLPLPNPTVTEENAQESESNEDENVATNDDEPQAFDPLDPANLPPLDAFPPPSVNNYPGFPILPIALGGGGGGGRRLRANLLPCENGTSDCNDKNPCTLDTCNESDICVHVLDPAKSEPGSCEVDGNACTVGKCVVSGPEFVCHEESRTFFEDPLGCNDGNDCTADSCVKSPLLNSKPGEQFDNEGNVILDNEPQCVNEIINGLACFIEEECTFGFCQNSGSGEIGDEFTTTCVSIGDQPQHFCPRPPGGNQCQIAICTMGVGCEIVNAPDDTICNDLDPCTEDDVCTGGFCGGTALVCSDDIPCTFDICDGSGECQHVPNDNVCTPSTNSCEEAICDAVAGCVASDLPSGTLCTDGDPCTLEDTCDGAGVCTAGASLSCPDTNLDDCLLATCTTGVGCATISADMGTSCDGDASICTPDTCDADGNCVLGAELTCADDGNPCTDSLCDATLGCTYPFAVATGADCTQIPCVAPEICVNGVCQIACNDNNSCTVEEICTAGVCLGTSDLDCDDQNICTDDSCAAIGGCFTTNLNGAVGNPCTITTEGVFGICTAGLTQCDDGVEMTDMCVQIFREGDKEETCLNTFDDDCDGVTDEAECACPTIPPGNTVFYVSVTGDNANDCLSEAFPCATIQQAHNNASSGDGIVLLAGTFNESGIIISKDLFIVGQGEGVTIINGGGSGVFTVQVGATLTLCGITVQNAANGLFNSGITTIYSSAFINNVASNGAGIFNNTSGVLNVFGTSFTGNNVSGLSQGRGGALLNLGTASLTNTTVANNTAGDGVIDAGKGGGIANDGTLTLVSSAVSGNNATGPTPIGVQGGGIYNNGSLIIQTSTIDNNGAADGAGIFIESGAVSIQDSTISNNSVNAPAGSGGGIMNFGALSLDITGSTINKNTASDGGGIFQAATMVTTNTTISSNTALSEGGGIYSLGSTILITTTVNDNTATTSGASIFVGAPAVAVNHTIVADQSAVANCNAPLNSFGGLSLSNDLSCGIVNAVNLNLGPLQNNGGPTQTHALIFPSDAIDTGDTTCGGAGVNFDQRGEPRPVDFNNDDGGNLLCDIGAFEIQNP